MKNDTQFGEWWGNKKNQRKKGREKVATDESLSVLISCHLTDSCKDFIGALV